MLKRTLFALIILLSAHASFASDADAYTAAITRAALHQTGTAKHPLITIDGDSVRMVSFATDTEYQNVNNRLGETIWTTVEPELKTLCQRHVATHNPLTHAALTAWLAKTLGMPTNDAAQRRFVIFDVPVIQAYYGSPAREIGIFRPCTDPRIGKHADGSPICPLRMNAKDSQIASEYKTWFINFGLDAYRHENGMPWTGYGYTYNLNDGGHGVSEFVVLKGTPIVPVVNPKDPRTAFVSPEQYCGIS